MAIDNKQRDGAEPPPEMPRRFRKKPVVIEAMQIDGTHETAQHIQSWVNANTPNFDPTNSQTWTISSYYGKITIRTLEGEMTAQKGDWIIKGIAGEFYPCRPDIFAETYEAEASRDPLVQAQFVTWPEMLMESLRECVAEHDKACEGGCKCEHSAISGARFLLQTEASSVSLPLPRDEHRELWTAWEDYRESENDSSYDLFAAGWQARAKLAAPQTQWIERAARRIAYSLDPYDHAVDPKPFAEILQEELSADPPAVKKG